MWTSAVFFSEMVVGEVIVQQRETLSSNICRFDVWCKNFPNKCTEKCWAEFMLYRILKSEGEGLEYYCYYFFFFCFADLCSFILSHSALENFVKRNNLHLRCPQKKVCRRIHRSAQNYLI